jgi:hypothetical protein
MSKVKVVAEDVNLYDIIPGQLTSDCHTVIRKDGVVDIVRAYKMVDIFDVYYDLGVRIQKVQLSGGTLNPRTQPPEA